jgi:hypothetical protein
MVSASLPRLRWTGPAILFVTAVLSLWPRTPAAGQVIGNAGGCATSRAMAEIGRVHAAMYAWYLDVVAGFAGSSGLAGSGPPLCPGGPAIDLGLVPPISVADLRALLVPAYIDAVPAFDPWERPYDYRLNLPDLLGEFYIGVRSSGADGLFEGSVYDIGPTGGPAEDLVILNTTWIREPPRLDPVSRQKVTLERIDTLGAAMLSYWTDIISGFGRSPAGGPTVDLAEIAPIAAPDLAALLLNPFYYTLCVPAVDGWGHPFDYRMNDEPLFLPFMSIRSPGRDGLLEGDLYDTELFPADDLDRDLVWSDGQYYQSPTPTRAAIFTDNFESGALWGTWSCGPGF